LAPFVISGKKKPGEWPGQKANPGHRMPGLLDFTLYALAERNTPWLTSAANVTDARYEIVAGRWPPTAQICRDVDGIKIA